MKGKYKRVKMYCPNCDRAIVAIGKKCPVCKTRIEGSKLIKPNQIEILKQLENED